MGCYDSQVINRVTLFQLDSCDRIPLEGTNATPAVKNLQTQLDNISRTRNVDTPADNTVKLVNGSTCTKPRATATDRGYTYTFNFCGGNPVVEAAAGYKLIDYAGSDIIGWEDIAITGVTTLAAEIVYEPSSDACAGETPQCLAVLIPKLEQWVLAGDQVNDGENTPDLSISASTALSGNVFGNYASSAELPDFLSHWASKFDDIALGRSWTITKLIDCPPTSDDDPCSFVAIDPASS